MFPEPDKIMNSRFISFSQVEKSLKENDHVSTMFASLRVNRDVMASDLLVVYDFPDVFPKDICELTSKCEVEFSIYLVHSIGSVSMAPYRMFASDLS